LLADGVEDAYPLTKLQLGMLFHSEYDPETAIYHDVFSYHLKAPLNLEIFRLALEHIVARQPVLRTSIAITQFSQPLQLVHSQASIGLTIEDITSLSLEEAKRNIAAWIKEEQKRPFPWAEPPLARFCLHLRSDSTFNLNFSFHHAILDGWSVATLLTELLQQYFSLLEETTSPLRKLPRMTFRDYVALEQQALKSREYKQYWHEKLADFTRTNLPRWQNSQESELVEPIKNQKVEIPSDLSAKIKQFANQVGVPLKSVLLAAHLKVMSFLSNNTDIITGVVTHGRPALEDSEKVLGLFLNTMPLRIQMGDDTWSHLVQQTFELEREALPFQQYPIAQLQQEVGLGEPLFETVFNYINFHVYQNLSSLERFKALGSQTFEQNNFAFVANYSVDPIKTKISLHLTYDLKQFNSEQVKNIGDYYRKVLVAMV